MNQIIDIVEAKPAMKVLCAVPFRDKTITELDVSGQSLGVEGALVIRRYLENNGALVTVNMMGNKIGKEQLSQLQEMMQAHPTLVSLCGIADDATEANLSGLGMDVDDALILADELPAKGALTSLNVSTNNLTQGASLKAGKRGWEHDAYETDMTGTQSHPAATNH